MPDTDWFDAVEPNGAPAWSIVIVFGDLVLTAKKSTLEPGSETRVTVWSANLTYLNKICTLTITNASIADTDIYTALMEPNAVDGVEAAFVVYGISVGESEFYADVEDGA